MNQIQTPNHHTLLLEIRGGLKNSFEAANASALLRLAKAMGLAFMEEPEDLGSVFADVEAVEASRCPIA